MADPVTVARSASLVFRIFKHFEELVGRPVSDFESPAEIEAAAEEALGHKLEPVSVEHEALQKRSQELLRRAEELILAP